MNIECQTVSVEEAGRILGYSRNTAYEAAHEVNSRRSASGAKYACRKSRCSGCSIALRQRRKPRDCHDRSSKR
jgi:hypothetical protein